MRESLAGYFIPVHDRIGVWPDAKIVGAQRHRGIRLCFYLIRYLKFETAISTQNFDTYLPSIVVWVGEP